MDPNFRRKKAPPLPKFEDKSQPSQKINEKVTDFLNQIEKESSLPSTLSQGQPEKKKINLSSLSSKLNSIKKIDLNKVVMTKKAEAEPKQRRQIQIEYDPAHPNSYDQAKPFYEEIFTQLAFEPVNKSEEEENYVLSKILSQYELEGGVEDDFTEDHLGVEEAHHLEEKEKIALRMMQKFGYKVGEGLGKDSQGIKTPLTIKKVTDSSCIIEPSSVPLTSFITRDETISNALRAFSVEVTPIVVLVLPIKLEQLTEEVEAEIKGECEKHGTIKQWVAFYLENQIRLFCEYEAVQHSFCAFKSINGRYYDEKVIYVHFYDGEKFENKQLGEELHKAIKI